MVSFTVHLHESKSGDTGMQRAFYSTLVVFITCVNFPEKAVIMFIRSKMPTRGNLKMRKNEKKTSIVSSRENLYFREKKNIHLHPILYIQCQYSYPISNVHTALLFLVTSPSSRPLHLLLLRLVHTTHCYI